MAFSSGIKNFDGIGRPSCIKGTVILCDSLGEIPTNDIFLSWNAVFLIFIQAI